RKINEVAALLGFEEPAYFTKMFTKMIGITPSQYRKRESAVHLGEIK
ncbi:MAG: AraC family transcriptional regulator, partial [Parabacteroides sp.]|nr:AraC family transcriptional regulator [Parabacteroides sp.]